MTFSPYVLFRRGTLDMADLAGVVPTRTWALLDEAADTAAGRAQLGERLCDALHRLVPGMPDEHRGVLLRARRAVHNDRAPDLAPDVVALLPAECRHLITTWCAERERGAVLTGRAATTYAEELDLARKTLADVVLHEDFERGLQLSGAGIHAEARAYAADPYDSARKASRRRRVESTIVSYAYRVVCKPSPFGSFTEIGAQPFDRTSCAEPAGRANRVKISIGLLAWMTHQLRGLDRADEILRIRLNHSLVRRGDHAMFVRRPIEGTDDTLTEDQVITARWTALVDLLVALLGRTELSERDLRTALTDHGLAPADAVRTIDQLVRLGLCHRGLGLPDQTVGIAGHAADILEALDTAPARDCVAILRRVQAIEDALRPADTAHRADLLAELRALAGRLATACGRPAPPDDALIAIVYEDLGSRGSARTWRPDVLRRNASNLALWQRLVPVLDDATVERLGLYRFYADRFGDAETGLIDCYAAFAELSPAEAGAVMSGVGDPVCDQVRVLRGDLCALVRGGLAAARDGVVHLDPAALRTFADALPAHLVPWRSAAYRVQLTGELAVVNGTTTGSGVFFSRFCDLLEPDEPDTWNLREQLRAHIAATSPRQTDITATLGLNFNLHPRLTPLELVYPGSVARPGAEHVHTLADVVVRPDPTRRRLTLVSTTDGQPLDLVPMNFLFPAAAPMLYRFLCAFAPTRTYRGGLWEQVDRHEARAVAERPRVLLGDLALDRRSWRLPVDALPALDGLRRQELAAMVAFDRWRAEHGMPRRLFFRLIAAPAPAANVRDLLAETRRWALEARSARMHKPHFLDTRNPFLLHVLAKQAGAMPDGTVLFTECLPDITTGTAEELFIEFNVEAADA